MNGMFRNASSEAAAESRKPHQARRGLCAHARIRTSARRKAQNIETARADPEFGGESIR